MERIIEMLTTTEKPLATIAADLGISLKTVRKVWDTMTAEFKSGRKKRCYSNSKLGTANPMLGKRSPKYKGVVSDSRGYLMVNKPDWYTGRVGSKHVFQHHIVACENLNLTEIPRGFVVHHCDENKHNNEWSNLILMSMADHARLHAHLGSATTISKESTAKWLEAHGTHRVMI